MQQYRICEQCKSLILWSKEREKEKNCLRAKAKGVMKEIFLRNFCQIYVRMYISRGEGETHS